MQRLGVHGEGGEEHIIGLGDRTARAVLIHSLEFELLKIQPDLRPTTAIRVMGFADPSTIRRLRDKYKALQTSTTAAPNNSGALHAPRTATAIAGTPQLMR